MTLVLRPYQQEAVDAVFAFWQDSEGNPLVVLPTGTGKSLVLAELSRVALAYPDTKVLVIAHVRELIRQNHSEMMELWPDAPAGIYSAGLNIRDSKKPLTFCSIQSVWKKATMFQKVDLVFVDEAHLIPFEQQTMYRKFLRDLLIINPHMKVVGLTATPFRLDGGRLDVGKDRMFHGVCYDYNIAVAIKQGFLCPPTSKPTQTQLDTDGVGTRGGEFIPGQLERAVNLDDVNRAVVDETVAWALEENRKSILFFCSGVAHAKAICEQVRECGFTCETIHAKTPEKERDDIIERFKRREIQAIASMNVLTTGFNAKAVDLIALLRPTKSASLYIQMVGRGTRLSPETGKVNCRILDFAGNIWRFGPIDAVQIKEPGEGEGDAPFKLCPQCGEICAAAARECKACGYEFPPPETQLAAKASQMAIISTEQNFGPQWVPVTNISYRTHQKMHKPDSMRVTYECGLSSHSTWVCFEHGGYAGDKARSWWVANGGQKPVPTTTAEALGRQHELTVPAEIRVRLGGDFVEVLAARGVSNLPRAVGAGVRLSPSLRDQCGF